MDQFKSFANNFSENQGSANTAAPNDNNAPMEAGNAPVAEGSAGATTNTANTANAGKEDYVDKGLDFVEKKFGHSQSRETNEKITDGARGMFEKFTGKKVPEKYSN